MTGFDFAGVQKEFLDDDHTPLMVVNIGKPGRGRLVPALPAPGVRRGRHHRLSPHRSARTKAPAPTVAGALRASASRRRGARRQAALDAGSASGVTPSSAPRPSPSAGRTTPVPVDHRRGALAPRSTRASYLLALVALQVCVRRSAGSASVSSALLGDLGDELGRRLPVDCSTATYSPSGSRKPRCQASAFVAAGSAPRSPSSRLGQALGRGHRVRGRAPGRQQLDAVVDRLSPDRPCRRAG